MATASDAVSFAQIQPEMSSAAAPAAISADAISSAEPSQAQINNETPTTTIKRPRAKPRIVLDGTPDEILARNSRAASPAFVDKLIQRAGTHWNRFYSNHARSSTPFFKDRHWTEREWPQLAQLADGESRSSTADSDGDGSDSAQERRRFEKGKGKAVLEVGCGTGAFIYPLLERYPHARFVAFDFAKKAVELTKDHPLYSLSSCHVFQHDLTLPLPVLSDKLAQSPPEFGDPVQEEDFDIVSCIFVLSALAPRTHAPALETLLSLLAPGGWLLFRDYALRDAAQLRFHSLPSASYATEPSLLSPRAPDSADVAAPTSVPPSDPAANTTTLKSNLPFYRRGDNTLTYFFTPEEIETHIAMALASVNAARTAAGKAPIELEGGVEVVEREMENRKEGWGCTRRFVHGSWRSRS